MLSYAAEQFLFSRIKAKVAIEPLKEQQTLQQLAQKHGVHPTQISSWKQESLQPSASVFTKGKKKAEAVDTARLYGEIGRLKVEVDFLKKRV